MNHRIPHTVETVCVWCHGRGKAIFKETAERCTVCGGSGFTTTQAVFCTFDDSPALQLGRWARKESK
jgi:DnaJ-class molecular chaperone